MAVYNYFNLTVQDIGSELVDLATDTIKVMLTNTLPVATNHVYSDISAHELASGNGYTTGGGTVTGVTYTNSGGTSTLTGNAFTWTSGPGNMGPFRYPVAYDSTSGTLLGWWDYGSSLTLIGADGDQFVWSPAGNTIATFANA
jgi:hypothetical protein